MDNPDLNETPTIPNMATLDLKLEARARKVATNVQLAINVKW